MQQYRPDHPWVTYDDMALLEALGAYCGPETGRETGLTYAGLLMFGKDIAIRRFFPRFKVNYYEHEVDEGVAAENRWSNRITPDGTWPGNLYQFFFRVLPLITSTLAVPFSLNEDLTSRGVSGTHLAVREALANALVHADYEGVGGVNIHRYPSGLVFSNPGTLLVPYERLFIGGLSECRNPELQTMFQRIGVVEKAGSGVATILRGWAEQVLRIPEVREESQPPRVVWTLPFISLIPKEEEQQLRRKVGKSRYNRLNVIQRIVLLLVAHHKLSSHSEIHRLLPGLHPAELSKTFSFLTRSCYITASGNGPATKYALTEFSDIPNNVDDIPNNVGDIPNNVGDIPNNADGIPNNADGIPNNSGEPSLILSEKRFSGDTIQALTAYKKRKRHTQNELEEIVLRLCEEHWMKLAELSEILNLKAEYLRSRVVQVLCRLNLLQRKFPGLRHTAQAYKKVH